MGQGNIGVDPGKGLKPLQHLRGHHLGRGRQNPGAVLFGDMDDAATPEFMGGTVARQHRRDLRGGKVVHFILGH